MENLAPRLLYMWYACWYGIHEDPDKFGLRLRCSCISRLLAAILICIIIDDLERVKKEDCFYHKHNLIILCKRFTAALELLIVHHERPCQSLFDKDRDYCFHHLWLPLMILRHARTFDVKFKPTGPEIVLSIPNASVQTPQDGYRSYFNKILFGSRICTCIYFYNFLIF